MSETGFYAKAAQLEQSGEAFSIATVVATKGSVPRREGSKMLVRADGSIDERDAALLKELGERLRKDGYPGEES